ncbi:MAG: leucine-rich repeat domain-containing protein [Aggregatilineales bacterium]
MTSDIAGLHHETSWWYWRSVFKTEVGYLRTITSRMLLPPINPAIRKNWRRMRKNLYRLPPEQRRIPNPYSEAFEANYGGVFYSLEEALNKPDQVRRLHLRGNAPIDLLAEIGRLTRLTFLDINDNKLTSLPEGICQLRTLASLYARNNHLTELPQGIGALANLREFYLDRNRLTTLPESIGDLSRLRTFSVGFNNLSSLPDNIRNLSDLVFLSLRQNQLTSLPEAVGNLTKLEGLLLGGNPLTSLSQNIGNLTGLKALNLSNLQLTTLPDSIGKLTQLSALDFTNNQLAELPESLANITTLSSLVLRRNRLRKLPDSLGKLALTILNVSGNPNLASLPGRFTVKNLDISDCSQLTSLPPHVFIVERLNVAGAGLTSLPDGVPAYIVHWRGVRVDPRIAFRPETITAQEVLNQPNAEVRRVMLERMGYEKFMQEANAEVLDLDRDPGGQRRLLRVPMERDEPVVCLEVADPSTNRGYLLRVPPTILTCQQAAAWIAGFDNPDDYNPLIET